MFINDPVLGRKDRDLKVADYGKFKNVPTTSINGVRYATIESVKSSKMRSQYFPGRRQKDAEDLNIIQKFRRFIQGGY
jgi:hypothetical protein